MSWKVANLCADRIFGSAARKQIIMFLADKASDDGSGIWCSKGTIQRHTELGESTVKRTITDFLREGILIETGRAALQERFHRDLPDRAGPGDGAGKLRRTRRWRRGPQWTPSSVTPVGGPRWTGYRGPRWTPNHPKTIHKPPTRKRAEAAADEEG